MMICKTTKELEDSLVAELGIERLFSVENQFQKQDGTVIQPIPIPGGMFCVSIYIRQDVEVRHQGFEIDNHTVRSIGVHAVKKQANAVEIGHWHSSPNNHGYSSIPIQLYRIEK